MVDQPYAVTRTSHYFVRPDEIVVQVVVSDTKQTLGDAEENTRTFHEIAAGRPRLLLVDMPVGSLDPNAREHYASEAGSRFVKACALVTPSAATRVMGNLFLALNNPGYPCRMFSGVDEAVAWLLARG